MGPEGLQLICKVRGPAPQDGDARLAPSAAAARRRQHRHVEARRTQRGRGGREAAVTKSKARFKGLGDSVHVHQVCSVLFFGCATLVIDATRVWDNRR